MPLYNYRAKTLDGKIISGELEANSEADLKLILKKQGMLLTNHKLKENKKINMFSSSLNTIPS